MTIAGDHPHVPRRTPRYRPIRDYGVIGNESSVALVRIDGSIDWCCLPYLDSPSVLGALLDADRGGYFVVRPAEGGRPSQRYVEDTNVLVTEFEVDGGRLQVHDFMPVGERLMGIQDAPGDPEIRRHLRCVGGSVDVDIVWVPRLDYARGRTRIESNSSTFAAHAGEGVVGLAGLPEGEVAGTNGGAGVMGHLALQAGEERILLMRWGDADPELDFAEAREELAHAVATWRDWVERPETGRERSWAGPWRDHVVRSELFLKLMSQPGSGALAAAATTSLPETLGGVRNWDYRYAWLRDAAQVAQAFFAVGHPEHVDAFVQWADEMVARESLRPGSAVQVLHPLRSGVGHEEAVLAHLEGYRGSRPVRIGNAAAGQRQLDVFGEILNVAFERARLAGELAPDAARFLRHLTDVSSWKWRVPDSGIWEMRNGPFHLVYSKIMAWAALHRAVWLEERGYLEGDAPLWRRAMEEVSEEVLRFGFDEELGSFVQRYGHRDLDAANLLIPMVEFLPADDPRVQGTINRTLEHLTVEDLVYRYRAEDGLPGEEGAFALCTCWLVDALTLSGRRDEAHRIFEGLLSRSNHVGLLSEQIDPYSGELLGNFPQAYSHLGIINSTLYLAELEGRQLPIGPLLGTRGAGSTR